MVDLHKVHAMIRGPPGQARKRYERQSAWLALNAEAPMYPHLPIIDPHHHFMFHPELDSWDHDKVPDLGFLGYERQHNLGGRGWKLGWGTDYKEEELLADCKGNNVKATVYIEAHLEYDQGAGALAPVGETRRVRQAFEKCVREARETKLCQGIVAYADMKLGHKVADVLRAHEAAGGGLLRGIRHSLASDSFVGAAAEGTSSPVDMHRLASFREGVSLLPRYGLTFDCWLFHHNIPALTELARACPGTTIVCNHVGYPIGVGPYADKERRPELFSTWKKDIAELATCPNVVMKVGGMTQAVCMMGQPVPWADLSRELPPSSQELADELSPWYLYSIDCFGPKRCMLESNWPMDRVSCSYTNLWNSFKIMCKDYSPQDKAALFHDTAARVYRLDGTSRL